MRLEAYIVHRSYVVSFSSDKEDPEDGSVSYTIHCANVALERCPASLKFTLSQVCDCSDIQRATRNNCLKFKTKIVMTGCLAHTEGCNFRTAKRDRESSQ